MIYLFYIMRLSYTSRADDGKGKKFVVTFLCESGTQSVLTDAFEASGVNI